MIVRELRAALDGVPDDAIVYAYEGEGGAHIVVDLGDGASVSWPAPEWPRRAPRDHEHCAEIGQCWQDRYPCPELGR